MKKLLLAILILALTVLSFSKEFSDISQDRWSYQYINRLATLGVIDGNPDGTFRPTNTLNREEMAAFLAKLNIYLEGKIAELSNANNPQNDQEIANLKFELDNLRADMAALQMMVLQQSNNDQKESFAKGENFIQFGLKYWQPSIDGINMNVALLDSDANNSVDQRIELNYNKKNNEAYLLSAKLGLLEMTAYAMNLKTDVKQTGPDLFVYDPNSGNLNEIDSVTADAKFNFSFISFDLPYTVMENENAKLDILVGLSNMEYENKSNTAITDGPVVTTKLKSKGSLMGPSIGLRYSQKLFGNLFVDAYAKGVSLHGDLKNTIAVDLNNNLLIDLESKKRNATAGILNLDLVYQLTKNIAFNLGIEHISLLGVEEYPDSMINSLNPTNTKSDVTISGISYGASIGF